MNPAEKSDPVDVRYIAGLARLALTDTEAAAYQHDLEQMLTLAAQLRQVDVANVPPLQVLTEAQSAWREDIPAPGLSREAALQNAPLVRQGQFVAPKVVE